MSIDTLKGHVGAGCRVGSCRVPTKKKLQWVPSEPERKVVRDVITRFGCTAVFSAAPGNWPSRLPLSEGPCSTRAARRPVNITQRFCVTALYARLAILRRRTERYVWRPGLPRLHAAHSRSVAHPHTRRGPARVQLGAATLAAASLYIPRSPSSRGSLSRPPAPFASTARLRAHYRNAKVCRRL